MRVWLMHLHECVFTFTVNMNGTKGVSPLDRFLSCFLFVCLFVFPSGSREEEVEKVLVYFFPHIISIFFFFPHLM